MNKSIPFSKDGFLVELQKFNDNRKKPGYGAVAVRPVAVAERPVVEVTEETEETEDGEEEEANKILDLMGMQVITCAECEKRGVTTLIVLANSFSSCSCFDSCSCSSSGYSCSCSCSCSCSSSDEAPYPPPGFKCRTTPLCPLHNPLKIDKHFPIKNTRKLFEDMTKKEVFLEKFPGTHGVWEEFHKPYYESDEDEVKEYDEDEEKEEDPRNYKNMSYDQLRGQQHILSVKNDKLRTQRVAANNAVIKNWMSRPKQPVYLAQPSQQVNPAVTCCEPSREKIKYADEKGGPWKDLEYYIERRFNHFW